MSEEKVLPQGTEVRIVSDPGRRGQLTGSNRLRSGVQLYQVKFRDDTSGYHAEYELEVIPLDHTDDAWQMLERGQFGNQRDLRRNLTHIQLNGKLANLVYSMDTTNTDFYAYQFKPVLSFLDSPAKGLLIADEVGLGKTIEAGLIWTELRARYDARRLLVICPAMLREKWAAELSQRFGITARIMDASQLRDELRKGKHTIPDGQGIVCSLQGTRPPRGWTDIPDSPSPRVRLAQTIDQLSDDELPIDLTIIDEAHYLRNPESQSASLGRLLRDVSENIILLSATPINLKSDDLYNLLNLVDPDSFGVKEIFPQVLAANEPLMRAREYALNRRMNVADIRNEITAATRHNLLKESLQLKDLLEPAFIESCVATEAGRVELANRIERVNLLQHVVSRTRKVEVNEWRVIREPKTVFVDLPPDGVERAFYDAVTRQIRDYAKTRDINAGFLLATPQKQVSSCMYAAAKAWLTRSANFVEQLYEDFGAETEMDEEIPPLIENLASEVLPDFDIEELRINDSKYKELIILLNEFFAESPTEKIIMFSFFRGTIDYLSDRLAEDGISNTKLMGGMARPKQEIIDEFREDSKVRILISSEVASEGVDLQFCRVLVNYDLPWNPMKIEQRIGRIDRIGQASEKINIRNLCYADTIDERVFHVLLERLQVFERALGGLEAVLGEEIASLTGDLLTQQLTPQEETKRIESTALAIEKIRQDESALEQQASHLIAHGGYILDQVKAAHQFRRRITDEDLVVYVQDYLNRYGVGHEFRQLKQEELLFDLRLPAHVANRFQDFIKDRRLFGRTSLQQGDTQRCRFINKVAEPGGQIEYINQFHPLIRFISQALQDEGEKFVPLIAVRIPAGLEHSFDPGVYAFATNRWSFEGLRTEEELRSQICRLDDERSFSGDESWDLLNIARLDGKDWFEVSVEIDTLALSEAINSCDTRLIADYEAAVRNRDFENRDRVRFQIQSADSHRSRKLASFEEVKEKHEVNNRMPLVAATEGRIRKLNEKFQIQRDRFQMRETLNAHHIDVSIGAVKVE